VFLPEFEDVMQPVTEDVMQPVTHGDSYEEAIYNAREVIELLIESCQAEGKPLPAPMIYQEHPDRKRRKLLDKLIELTEEAGLYEE